MSPKFWVNFFSCSIVCFLVSCDTKTNDSGEISAAKQHESPDTLLFSGIPYNLLMPDKKYFLPDELEEISGVNCLDTNKVACIQDEEGKLYQYKLTEKKISQKTKFAKAGDYEDLAIVDNQVYVLKSNGSLYTFPFSESNETEAEEIKTPLSDENDVEGLCYDARNKRLLLACKGNKDLDGKKINFRAIFEFDLKTRKLNKTPVYKIEEKKLAVFLAEQKIPLKKDNIVFKPSGLAVHPIEGTIYIIASEGNLLLVIDKSGKFKAAAVLPAKVFKQPEGISFLPDGTLFISNEGRGSSGNILKFLYLKH